MKTVELQQVTDDRYGGKAAGLAELIRLGLDVPPGFVIVDAGADLVVVDTGPTATTVPAAPTAPASPAVGWFHRMADAGATPVAVRSSAVGEDGAAQSFAGQYDTVLGVDSAEALADAVRTCVASAASRRAAAYRGETRSPAPMHLVVQQMVDARAAGVVFTADPTTARRDLMVIDAVAGLGDSLVDGTASPDHVVLDPAGRIAVREVGGGPVVTEAEIAAIRAGALRAERHWGRPMDLEWAIDRAGRLWWLQARPVTTLPADLGDKDSTLAGADHVYTRCNIGEMMPGAFCPLTESVSGYAIDHAMQMVQVVARAQPAYERSWLQVGYFSGHMFLNLTEGTALSSGLLGNSLEQFSTSICGRVVDELVPKPPQPFLRRLGNTVRLSTFALTAGPAVRRLGEQISGWGIPRGSDPLQVWRQLEAGVDLYCAVTLTHVRSSSRAAVAANVLESTVVRRAVAAGGSEDDGRAEASRLMAGADDVESAVMLAELESVVRALAADEPATDRFLAADPGAAVAAVLASADTWGVALRRFLARHGHRGYRELCMRDASWADDPEGLGAIMQAMVRSTLARGGQISAVAATAATAATSATAAGPEPGSRAIRVLARLARGGARGREETKSKMALMAHALKRGYRHLGEVLAADGRLPDADLVFFFDRPELACVLGDSDLVTGGLGLGELGAGAGRGSGSGLDGGSDRAGAAGAATVAALISRAEQRREALAYQDALEFPDVSVGRPVPLIARPPREAAGGEIVGRPASRGTVEGVVRVARSIVDAREVRPGEVLVAPVTDVGWTPYFTVIAALVTDIGSPVSHGAVVAREYGLPCVVNTIVATQTLRTGDRVHVDGDRGVVTRLEG
ncbi:PEP/pyruvate-binding domain-containing protein [Dietzia lutea]|uniref:Pyruvate, water dikinase n=2 Tax=Dietzia lutea TaxID=546160 RepID=A0A2S1R986_9ACTN|nr:PEP/pyruvate-binding domain-containing protein [Dietzia lutea]AWH92858.1 pyruvate, water dikinase [Dietzia lutea]